MNSDPQNSTHPKLGRAANFVFKMNLFMLGRERGEQCSWIGEDLPAAGPQPAVGIDERGIGGEASRKVAPVSLAQENQEL
jgi:hypothetical protein